MKNYQTEMMTRAELAFHALDKDGSGWDDKMIRTVEGKMTDYIIIVVVVVIIIGVVIVIIFVIKQITILMATE